MTADALSGTPDDGLVHRRHPRPAGQPGDDESPYFLRETQRASQADQVPRSSRATRPAATGRSRASRPQSSIATAHRSWSSPAGDARRVRQARGHRRPARLRRLARPGRRAAPAARRRGIAAPADLVLAGHTHRHNEFTVRPAPPGEFEFRMDFYTQNPAGYYPTRYLTGWRPAPGRLDRGPRRTRRTSRSRRPALASTHPWPMPSRGQARLDRPGAAVRRSARRAPDAGAWWDRHRPLVLQTGALGPLENDQFSFSGFRVLTVEGGVITAIQPRPDGPAPRRRLPPAVARRRAPGPAPAARARAPLRGLRPRRGRRLARPAARCRGRSRTASCFADGHGHLHDLYEDGAGRTGTVDLDRVDRRADGRRVALRLHGAVGPVRRGATAATTATSTATTGEGSGDVGHDDLSGAAGGPKADGDPVGYLDPATGMSHVYYRSANGHLHEIWWGGADDAPGTGDLTKAARAVPATGRPSAYGVGGTNVVVYRATRRADPQPVLGHRRRRHRRPVGRRRHAPGRR